MNDIKDIKKRSANIPMNGATVCLKGQPVRIETTRNDMKQLQLSELYNTKYIYNTVHIYICINV